MARKKLSDMTPIERMNKFMDGLSWDEAEEVGVEILGKCMALHHYARKENEEYMMKVFRRICERADEWAHSEYGAFVLAMAASANKHDKKEHESLNTQQNE